MGSQTAIIVGVQVTPHSQQVEDDLVELRALLETLGVETKEQLIQRRPKLSAGYLLGTGKIDEIREIAGRLGATLVVIDHPLTGPQTRNIEKITKCRVLDRSAVILEIFARHAQTNHAKTQVEIAQLEYLLPRLSGAWTHFQRQTGGGVKARGMGEKQIEVDRRRVRERIQKLQKKLYQIEKERKTQRHQRRNELKVSIVGYTNSGKTTIMRGLTKVDVTGVNKLFATLDSRVSPLDPATRPRILLTDTVGFIRNLPHSLIDSFKSTLEEVLMADLLVHVVDLSHPNYVSQMKTTVQVLDEIGASSIPMVHVFNKIDAVTETFLPNIVRRSYDPSIVISAQQKKDVLKLKDFIFQYFTDQFFKAMIKVPAENQNLLSFIYQNCLILGSNYEEFGEVLFEIRASQKILNRLRQFIINESSHDYKN